MYLSRRILMSAGAGTPEFEQAGSSSARIKRAPLSTEERHGSSVDGASKSSKRTSATSVQPISSAGRYDIIMLMMLELDSLLEAHVAYFLRAALLSRLFRQDN